MREIKERLIERIRKLIAHEQSARHIGSIAEATAFAERIQQLLLEHKLSISEIEASGEVQPDTVAEEVYFTTETQIPLRHRSNRDYLTLFYIVAKNHYCESIIEHGSNMIYLIGREEDRAVAVEMFSYLLATMRRLCSKERKSRRSARRSVRNFRSSFYRGFIGSIALRYDSVRKECDENTALVLSRSADEVRKKTEELHPDTFTRPASKRDRVNKAALMAGVLHGRQVNLATNVIQRRKPVVKHLTDGNRDE